MKNMNKIKINKKNRKALSPVIATVLLISLVLILATIIFLWAKSWFPEQLEKGGSPIQDKCKEVNFIAEYDDTAGAETVSVLNQGNLPIYGIKVGVKKGLSLDYIDASSSIKSQIIAGIPEHFSVASKDVEGASEIIVVPILLGKNSDGELKTFVCDSDYGYTIELLQ